MRLLGLKYVLDLGLFVKVKPNTCLSVVTIVADPAKVAENGDFSNVSKDLLCLQEAYTGCVCAVIAAIDTYASTTSLAKAEERALAVLNEHLLSTQNTEFRLTAYDQYHRELPLKEGEHSLHLKTAHVTVFNIPSLEQPGKSLGSVSFAETFCDCSYKVLHPDGSEEKEGSAYILTENVPRYLSWPNKGSTSAEKAKASAGLGHCLLEGEEAIILNPLSHATFHDGPMYIYNNGLILNHACLGPILLAHSHLKSIAFYDGDSPSIVALLILTLKPEGQGQVPPCLKSQKSEVIIAFTPKSKAYKLVFSEVLPVWKNGDKLPLLERLETLPDHLLSLHRTLQDCYTQTSKPGVSPLKLAEQVHPTLTRFQRHLEESSCLHGSPVLSCHLPAFQGNTTDPGAFQDELLLTIVAGLPGSYKEELAHLLTSMAKDDNRWALLRQPTEQMASFSRRSLQANLAAVCKQYKQKRHAGGKSHKKRRAIVLTPGYVDLVDVIQAIISHPEAEVASSLQIGAVTTCINPENSYMTDKYFFPKFLEQCSYGFVNNIVFTGSQNRGDGRLNEMQALIRVANPDVNLLLAEKAQVTRTPDLDLILSEKAFSDPALTRARYLTSPGWAQGQFVTGPQYPSLGETVISFTRPLNRQRLLQKLKGLKNQLQPYPFVGNIYSLRGRFMLNDADKLLDFCYIVATGDLDLVAVDQQPGSPSKSVNGMPHSPSKTANGTTQYFMIFNGCELSEEALRMWLRDCVPPKPEKKALRTLNTLTKAEIKKVHEKHHLEPLPEGWFYNGSQYINMAGDKSSTHPGLDRFLQDYLDNSNKEIDIFNDKIDQLQYQDLFD